MFPNADVKVFLTADHRIRAIRRQSQFADKGILQTYADTNADACRRDFADFQRELSPLEVAPDAFVIDSTDLAPDEVADEIIKLLPASITADNNLTLDKIEQSIQDGELVLSSIRCQKPGFTPEIGLTTRIRTVLEILNSSTINITEYLTRIVDLHPTPDGYLGYSTTEIPMQSVFTGTFEQLLESEFYYPVIAAINKR